MRGTGFGKKPSPSHIIWSNRRGNETVAKHFDEKRLRRWCAKYDVDFETEKRVDHDRSDEPRTQYQLVFSWAESASESFDVGDEHWDIQTQQTPRTFIEIDGEGVARIQSWDGEYILDITELRHDGPTLLVSAVEFDGTKRLDARTLKSR